MLPAGVKSEVLEDLRVTRFEQQKLVELRMKKLIFGVTHLEKKEKEEPSCEDLLSAPLSHLVQVTNVIVETKLLEVLYCGPDTFNIAERCWLYSEISWHD